MSDLRNGPPEKEVGPRPGRHSRTEDTDTTNTSTHHSTGYRQNNRFDDSRAQGRRHGAAVRSTPIGTCSCIRDPERDRHRCGGGISDVMADAAVTAIKHLDTQGTPGLLGRDLCQAIWKRGHRRLAADIATRAGWSA